MSKEELNGLFEVFLHVCEEERWHVLQNPLEPPLIISFAHRRTTKPFSNISDQANKLLEHLLKASGKPISNEQMRKLFDFSELRSVESKTNSVQLQRTTPFLSGSLF